MLTTVKLETEEWNEGHKTANHPNTQPIITRKSAVRLRFRLQLRSGVSAPLRSLKFIRSDSGHETLCTHNIFDLWSGRGTRSIFCAMRCRSRSRTSIVGYRYRYAETRFALRSFPIAIPIPGIQLSARTERTVPARGDGAGVG